MNLKNGLFTLLILAACATAPMQQRQEIFLPLSLDEAYRKWQDEADTRLPSGIQDMVTGSFAAIKEGKRGSPQWLRAVSEYFNQAAGSLGWTLRPITEAESRSQPWQCKCTCYYLMLFSPADRETRWQVTTPGGCEELSFSPWRFRHERYAEITPANVFPIDVDLGLTLPEMLAQANFDGIETSPQISIWNIPFPSEPKIRVVTLRLMSFGRKVKTDEVEKLLAGLGMRPASLAETLAFATTNQRSYAKWRIIALNWGYELSYKTSTGNHQERYFASLDLGEWRVFSFREREYRYRDRWDEETYFLVAKDVMLKNKDD